MLGGQIINIFVLLSCFVNISESKDVSQVSALSNGKLHRNLGPNPIRVFKKVGLGGCLDDSRNAYDNVVYMISDGVDVSSPKKCAAQCWKDKVTGLVGFESQNAINCYCLYDDGKLPTMQPPMANRLDSDGQGVGPIRSSTGGTNTSFLCYRIKNKRRKYPKSSKSAKSLKSPKSAKSQKRPKSAKTSKSAKSPKFSKSPKSRKSRKFTKSPGEMNKGG